MEEPPSYHDLHITLDDMERTSIFNLPYNVRVQCTRVGGWEVWHRPDRYKDVELLAGEYGERKLRMDVAGFVIVDSLSERSEREEIKATPVSNPQVTDEDRRAAADLLDQLSNLLDHNGIGQVADLIRDGGYDEHEATRAFARHRSMAQGDKE